MELINVDESGRMKGRGGKRGKRGGKKGGNRERDHKVEKLDSNDEEEVLGDSDNTEEKEESIELITGESKGKKINKLLKKDSKEDEEIQKAEMEQKKDL
jgi:hypothetical protein